MNPKSMVESVKEGVAQARTKAEMVAAHSQDVIRTGARTLHAAKDVVVGAGREAAQLAARTKVELGRTLKEGASQVGDRLSRLTTPTRKEMAAARKLEVKARKQRKREEAQDEAQDQAQDAGKVESKADAHDPAPHQVPA